MKDIIKRINEALTGCYSSGEVSALTRILTIEQLGIPQMTFFLKDDVTLTAEQQTLLDNAIERLKKQEPIQYILGYCDFCGLRFKVTPATLIPRPETEVLCDRVVRLNQRRQVGKVLDLCTGSGCIAWTLALEMPGADVTAVDISDGALRVASSQDFSEEAARTGALAPTFVKADVLKGPENHSQEVHKTIVQPDTLTSDVDGRYDVIVSNPPYVMDSEKALMRTNVLEHEPHLALFVPDEDPLVFYRAVADWASRLLKKGGYGIVEINEALGEQTAEVFRKAGLRNVGVVKDLSDRDRFVEFYG